LSVRARVSVDGSRGRVRDCAPAALSFPRRVSMPTIREELHAVWKAALSSLRRECGYDKEKFAACEILALRMLARQILLAGGDSAPAAPKPAKKPKNIIKRKNA